MSHLKMAKADGAHLKELSRIEKQDALILDDFGVQPFDPQSRALLLDIIEDRHGKRSTIITAQVPVKKWHEVIGEKTLADAIMDRIVHQSIRIELYGESLRKKTKGRYRNNGIIFIKSTGKYLSLFLTYKTAVLYLLFTPLEQAFFSTFLKSFFRGSI